MLRSTAPRLVRLLTVQGDSPALSLAQLVALKKRMPLLYVMVLINTATVAYTHLAVAPPALVLLPLIAVAVFCIVRSATWLRLDIVSKTQEERLRLLQRTNRLAAVLGCVLLVWSSLLNHYASQQSAFHLLYFLTLTSLGCIFCLMHLRSAALIVACCVTVPALAFILNQHGSVPRAMAVNLLLITIVVGFVLFLQYADFLRLVKHNEELRELGLQNERLATTDMLTGLPNRRTFFPALESLVDRCGREGGGFVLALVNLQAFKRINETNGRLGGDQVLSAVAQRLAGLPSLLLARVGGDEFALLVHDENLEAAQHLGAAVQAALAEPADCGASRVELKAAVGLTRWSPGDALSELLEHANYAVAESKAIGRPVLFGDEHLCELRARLQIEAALRSADLETQLSLAYQPMVDVDTGRTFAFEALARWRHPELGNVRPDHFIIAAERMGMISDVTLVLLRKLLRDMAAWPDQIRASFNLSMHDITSAEAIAAVINTVEAAKATPDRLQFEITETAALKDFALAQAGLRRLKALGGRLALDDFGTGYSSLGHVHRLPVDKLKIDSSFTRELTTASTARSIIASIVGLAHGLELECVVEGVETTEQAVLLRGLGCRLMQGYLFAKPMLADEVVPYLADEAIARTEAESGSPETLLQLA